jgi:hypothetical protein
MTEDQSQTSVFREMIPLVGSILLPALVWALEMEVNYALVRRACSAQRSLTLHLVTVAALLLTAVSIGIAWKSWRRAGKRWPNELADMPTRIGFLSILGLLVSSIFFLVILAQGIATVFFYPCQS